jgi:TolB-like protein
MADDEEATVSTLKAYRAAFDDLAQQYRGRVVDSPGDNILAEFGSVVDAVNCAVEIQRELAERNAELTYNRKMEFRIGVNLGDVIEEDGRIYGDGVNIAARVESLAEPGSVCISGRAYDQVENKLGLKYENLGEHQVKNIARPIRLYRVLSYPGAAAHRVANVKKSIRNKLFKIATLFILTLLLIFAGLYSKYYYLPVPIDIDPKGEMSFELPTGPSIAVLPLVNIGMGTEQEYFCDGITDNIIYALSHFPQLYVIARDSVFSYKDKQIAVKKIGQELGAEYIIEGSVQRYEDNIRITIKLIKTENGFHIWSNRYDRRLEKIFQLQDEIAIGILKALPIFITGGENVKSRIEGVDDLKILTKLLKAFSYIYHDSRENISLLRKEVKDVLNSNPNLAVAHFLMGFSYIFDLWLGGCEYPIVCFGKATESVRKTLALDNENSDAHFLAGYLFLLRKEHDKAITEMKRAIYLNPNNADAYANLGFALYCDDRPLEGLEFITKAISLNPITPSLYYLILGNAFRGAKQYEKAIDAYNKSLTIRPQNNIFTHVNLVVTSLVSN